jgi:hypothetical protein
LLFAPATGRVKGFNTGPTDYRPAHTVDKGHGRIETRHVTVTGELHERWHWPYLAQVFCLERTTQLVACGQVRQEVVYGMTSLSAAEAGPQRLLEIVRTHWQIKNGLHYRREVTFHEDAGRTRHWTMAHALAAMHNLVLALLLHAGHTNLAKARHHYGAHPDDALRLLLARPA